VRAAPGTRLPAARPISAGDISVELNAIGYHGRIATTDRIIKPFAGRLACASDTVGGGAIEHVQGGLLATCSPKQAAPGPEHRGRGRPAPLSLEHLERLRELRLGGIDLVRPRLGQGRICPRALERVAPGE
jgi:hypothetical protein